MRIIVIASRAAEELIDITAQVERLVASSEIAEGVCHLFCRHTTAGLIVNEHCDPDVARDILLALRHIVPDSLPYRHGEGNSTAHVKSVLTGVSLQVPICGGKLALGRWQGVFFAEFDGPRPQREIACLIQPLPLL
jgi:secondary thiamine-phosphate synthase enzyme